jgi:hypothetical protein
MGSHQEPLCPAASLAAKAPSSGPRSLQSQFEAQTPRLWEIQRTQRPKNTQKACEPKQKKWREWCAGLDGNTDGAWGYEG